MGNQNVHSKFGKKERLVFVHHLLSDIAALEKMLKKGLIESGIARIGAEQECFIVDQHWRPAKKATALLSALDDTHFTTEIGRFNLEINLDPVELKARAFSIVENQLVQLLEKAKQKARDQHCNLILTGILPSLSNRDLTLENMTESPRYFLLNDRLKELKRGDFIIHLAGLDEVTIHHDSVMFEACNTSFQMHLQIDPDEFAASYNWAQAISGPVLGMCVNSPILFGRELWSETRIGLFQQSVDVRPFSRNLLNKTARVSFGDSWLRGNVVDFFKNEVSNHKMIMSKNISKTALEQLATGQIPRLDALNLHNGTIYRWNRVCYGLGNGQAHLRIENRYLPSGPTVIDEMANFAFWIGLMKGMPASYQDITKVMDFADAKTNFMKAARTGSESIMTWMGEKIPLTELVKKKLLPMAKQGLECMNIDTTDIDRLLGIIEERTSYRTPAQWSVDHFRRLKKTMKPDVAALYLTKLIHANQKENIPAHLWPSLVGNQKILGLATEVGHIMSTQVYTVFPEDSAELIFTVMSWKNIHHLPVVDQSEYLMGLLTWNHMEKFREETSNPKHNLTVGDVMLKSVITVEPNTKLSIAKSIINNKQIGCLPVVHFKQLVGIITLKDLYPNSND